MKMLIAFIILVGLAETAFAKRVIYRKTQEVSFDGSDVDGLARNPDGAYVLQKKGIKFLPLYRVRKKFDDEIKSSVDQLR
ncbi:MAG: hypothetical protein CL675_09675 [Bdellovibrionaceae bacterium]|nr:hypothetical protein [Pseudobdellovibrionaceae bacterium]|tara:strand:- start:165 stop:404 length:240 start_codon:yes stop_codon:yes gene_type:complete